MPAVSSDFPADPHRPAGSARRAAAHGSSAWREETAQQHASSQHSNGQDSDEQDTTSCSADTPDRRTPHGHYARHRDGHADEHQHSLDHQPRPDPEWDQETLSEAGDLLRALAAPVRIAIVLQLRTAESCVHDLVDALGVTQPLISQHLRVLKSAGVVRGERHGREVVYRLVDEHLAHIVVDAAAHAEEVTGTRPGRRVAEPRTGNTEHSGQDTETG